MKITFSNLSKGIMAVAFGLALVFAGSAFKSTENQNKKALRYWYSVSYDDMVNHPNGYIKSGTPVFAYAEQEAVESPCEEGDELDCLRGFEAPITVFPNDDLSTPKIQKPIE
ncbi:hypothetical protein DU508_23175 [Pedobacter chinensis]|uniref:Uncharacterized protein n=1 Tax=Pedobacter chinensis TaxID=2282421 RepID=A0A369PVK5_9SPHI|nr:hypothetical protein [Pedobacter chinensis]RDC54138.1 hypothetical protein DU508_23175 [Pedobacter chinensis]